MCGLHGFQTTLVGALLWKLDGAGLRQPGGRVQSSMGYACILELQKNRIQARNDHDAARISLVPLSENGGGLCERSMYLGIDLESTRVMGRQSYLFKVRKQGGNGVNQWWFIASCSRTGRLLSCPSRHTRPDDEGAWLPGCWKLPKSCLRNPPA